MIPALLFQRFGSVDKVGLLIQQSQIHQILFGNADAFALARFASLELVRVTQIESERTAVAERH